MLCALVFRRTSSTFGFVVVVSKTGNGLEAGSAAGCVGAAGLRHGPGVGVTGAAGVVLEEVDAVGLSAVVILGG